MFRCTENLTEKLMLMGTGTYRTSLVRIRSVGTGIRQRRSGSRFSQMIRNCKVFAVVFRPLSNDCLK